MAVIGPVAIERIMDHVGALCEAYREQIDDAYLNADNDLKVAFTVHLSPGKAVDDLNIETGMSFIASKVKDSVKDTVSERQTSLLDEFEKNPDIQSVTIGGKEIYRREQVA